MPILNVKVSAKRSPEMTERIAAILLDLTTRILKKKPEVTSIAIDYLNPDDWLAKYSGCAKNRAEETRLGTRRGAS